MELAPEKLIEMLEKGESLPNVILMYGEENYYRSKAAACIKKYVFGSAADEDMEISVFDRDTDLKRLNAAVNTYPFFGGSSLVIISDDKIFAAEKKQKENLEAILAKEAGFKGRAEWTDTLKANPETFYSKEYDPQLGFHK